MGDKDLARRNAQVADNFILAEAGFYQLADSVRERLVERLVSAKLFQMHAEPGQAVLLHEVHVENRANETPDGHRLGIDETE